MSDLRNPHDRFFRELFAHPEVAADFLRHYLPEKVAALLDPASPQLRKDSFVDEALQEHLSDLLYEVRLREGEDAYIYVLFEHKSYPEPLVAFQLLRYLVRIWEQELDQKGRPPLSPIIPLVVYHGRSVWTVPLDLAALFAVPEALREFFPDFRYHLSDLTTYEDEEIKGAVRLQVGLLLMKYIFRGDLLQRLPGILSLIRELAGQQTGLEFLKTLLYYVSAASERVTKEVLRDALITAFPQEEGTLMATLAEQWLQQGLEQGVQESILEVLEARFGMVSDPVLQQIRGISELHVLRALLRDAVRVESLQVFEERLTSAI